MGEGWLARYARLIRKANRQRIKKSVRAYRQRKCAKDLRRVELLLSGVGYSELRPRCARRVAE